MSRANVQSPSSTFSSTQVPSNASTSWNQCSSSGWSMPPARSAALLSGAKQSASAAPDRQSATPKRNPSSMNRPLFALATPRSKPSSEIPGQFTSRGRSRSRPRAPSAAPTSKAKRHPAAPMPSSSTPRLPIRRMFARRAVAPSASRRATSSGPMPAGSPAKSAIVGFALTARSLCWRHAPACRRDRSRPSPLPRTPRS